LRELSNVRSADDSMAAARKLAPHNARALVVRNVRRRMRSREQRTLHRPAVRKGRIRLENCKDRLAKRGTANDRLVVHAGNSAQKRR